MLTAIGVIIIMKQLPHAIGYDVDNEGDFFFIEKGEGHNTFSSIIDAVNYSHPGAILVTVVSLLILTAFNKIAFLKNLKVIPGALIAVLAGITINEILYSKITWSICRFPTPWRRSGASLLSPISVP
jgi:MFS superfamily sulfate permease-like transporter